MRTVLSLGLMVLGAAPASGQRARELGTFPVVIGTVSPGVVRVSWQPVAKATAYDGERCEGSGLSTCTRKAHLLPSQPLYFPDNLTASGTYLYRVTAYGPNQLPMAQGQVGYQYDMPTAVLMPPPTGTITPTVPAGPAQLTAASPSPGQIHLSWSLVPYATSYHVLRSVVGQGGQQELPLPDISAYTSTPYRYVDAPVDLRWTYSYQVYAMVKPATTEVQSGFSPMATAASLPFTQVSGLTYTLAPSVRTPGRVDLTLRWNQVAGVEKYIVWDKTYNTLLREVYGPMYYESELSTKMRFTACVGAQYPYNIRQPATEPCIDIQT